MRKFKFFKGLLIFEAGDPLSARAICPDCGADFTPRPARPLHALERQLAMDFRACEHRSSATNGREIDTFGVLAPREGRAGDFRQIFRLPLWAAAELGEVPMETLRRRIRAGWIAARRLDPPRLNRETAPQYAERIGYWPYSPGARPIGPYSSIGEAAHGTGLGRVTIERRLAAGWDPEEALQPVGYQRANSSGQSRSPSSPSAADLAARLAAFAAELGFPAEDIERGAQIFASEGAKAVAAREKWQARLRGKFDDFDAQGTGNEDELDPDSLLED